MMEAMFCQSTKFNMEYVVHQLQIQHNQHHGLMETFYPSGQTHDKGSPFTRFLW